MLKAVVKKMNTDTPIILYVHVLPYVLIMVNIKHSLHYFNNPIFNYGEL